MTCIRGSSKGSLKICPNSLILFSLYISDSGLILIDLSLSVSQSLVSASISFTIHL